MLGGRGHIAGDRAGQAEGSARKMVETEERKKI